MDTTKKCFENHFYEDKIMLSLFSGLPFDKGGQVSISGDTTRSVTEDTPMTNRVIR